MSITVTRVVHASVLIDFDGQTFLTDPWFSERPGYLWGEPLGVTVDRLPRLAGVIVSHAHYDHYDIGAFSTYPDKGVAMIVKRGTAGTARKAGFTNVTEVDPWEKATIGSAEITAAPARHGVPENTYVIQRDGATIFFGADTLLIPALSEVARRFPRIDLALLPINGLRLKPAFNRKIVMNGVDAAVLCSILKPRVAIPIHYAFRGGPISDSLLLGYDRRSGSPEAFRELTQEKAPSTRVEVLEPGQSLQLP
jgi:L-ascorbate metabolism protein UlaG (beta-lactamase superfamily)